MRRGLCVEFGVMRSEIPPPDEDDVPEWSIAIVAGVWTYLPDARAVRKGSATDDVEQLHVGTVTEAFAEFAREAVCSAAPVRIMPMSA
jgi:hypothetical protein